MTSQMRRALEAVAVAVGLMLCASVAHSQSAADQERNRDAAGVINQSPYGQAGLAARNPYNYTPQPMSSKSATRILKSQDPGGMHVACWAEVPSHNTAYFSATFLAPSAYSARKEFRQLVTTQYGPVSSLRCAGKFSETVVNGLVEKWKDSARSTKNAIVDTDWRPDSPLTLSSVVSPPPFVPELQ